MTDNNRILCYDEKQTADREQFAQMVAALLKENVPFDMFREHGELRITVCESQPPF